MDASFDEKKLTSSIRDGVIGYNSVSRNRHVESAGSWNMAQFFTFLNEINLVTFQIVRIYFDDAILSV